MMLRPSLVALGAMAVLACPAFAQDAEPARFDAILAELQALKVDQAKTAARIEALEGALEATGATQSAPSAEPPVRLPSRTAAAPVPAVPATFMDKLKVTSDLLLRYEGNYSDESAPDRERGVMRARIGASYDVSDTLMVGALLETGDPDDPNSGYLTMSDFADDLQVSLSRAYVGMKFGDAKIYGGKFPKPFDSTDLLWDGDVNPMGLGAVYERELNDALSLKASGLYFIVDESAGGADSNMVGGQLKLTAMPSAQWKTWLAAAYYDYELNSVAGADAGDIRSNLLLANGEYLSDYNIVDVLAGATWSGWSPQWPVTLKGDYVMNQGAAVDDDTAYEIDLIAGKSSAPGDLGLSVGYAQAEVDSVLAAFSNDNFGLATNYETYKFSIDYVPVDHVKLNATLYHYAALDAAYATSSLPGDWLDRLRLNLIFSF
jgi:putative porin